MTRETLIDEIADSLCNSADQRTLLELYYNVNYDWLESLSRKDLLEEARHVLREKVEIEDYL